MFRPDTKLFDDRFTIPLSGLRQLTLTYCTFKQLGMIFCEAKYLISLNVVLEPDDDSPDNDSFEQIPSPSLSLNRLTIELYYNWSMIKIEQFLRKMLHLKHLTIKGHGNVDLVDGSKWQPLVTHLTTFNFDLIIRSLQIDNDLLDTFRSAFWLVEKRWFVVFYKKQLSQLFTAPLFASQQIDFPLSMMSYHSLAPDIEQIVAEHVEKLSIQDSTVSAIHCYQRVKSLELHCSNISSLETLSLIVNLATVEHLWIAKATLSLPTMIDHFHMLMPCLHSLTIDDAHPLLDFDYPETVFKQIRTLELTFNNDNGKATASTVNVSHLCRLFSHVKHLTMRINSFEDMTNVIDALEHLSSVRFNTEYFCCISSVFDLTKQWFVSNIRPRRMSNKNDCTFKFSISCDILLWI